MIFSDLKLEEELSGKDLKVIRKKLGYTQLEIADIMATTNMTISRIELGDQKRSITLKFYRQVLFLLNRPTEEEMMDFLLLSSQKKHTLL